MANTPIREPTLYVLSALAAGPLHGYASIKTVEELSDHLRAHWPEIRAGWDHRTTQTRRARFV